MEAPSPPKVYHVLARNIVEAAVQVQLDLKYQNIERARRDELARHQQELWGQRGKTTKKKLLNINRTVKYSNRTFIIKIFLTIKKQRLGQLLDALNELKPYCSIYAVPFI